MDQQHKNVGTEPSEQRTGLPTWKRVFDLALVLIFLPALLILGAAVAFLVACGSPGPVFFRQRRVGYKGREFTCLKFRTMRVDAETTSHRDYFRQLMESDIPMTKLDARSDPRLVPLGTLLRATGLDELPQFLNIIRGEMSIVGPRPCIPYEYERYQPWQRQRSDAVPGLTGLWQVSGKNRTTFNEMIQFDIDYSKRLSPWLDLQIIFKTLPALCGQCSDLRARKRNQALSFQAETAKTLNPHHP